MSTTPTNAVDLFGGARQLVDIIGREVFSARNKLGWDEAGLAEHVGVSTEDIFAIERARERFDAGERLPLPPRSRVLTVLCGLSLKLDHVLLFGEHFEAETKRFWKKVIKDTSARAIAGSDGTSPNLRTGVTDVELEIFLRQKALDEVCVPEKTDVVSVNRIKESLRSRLGDLSLA
jgi:hypothetical protein